MAWRAARNCLPTTTELIKRGVILQQSDCVFCLSTTETNTHLFTGCLFSTEVCNRVENWCRLPPSFFFDVQDLILLAENSSFSKDKRHILRGIVYTTLWVIWNERNARIFTNKKRRPLELVEIVKSTSFFWCHEDLHAINHGDSGFVVIRDGCTIFQFPVVRWKARSGGDGRLQAQVVMEKEGKRVGEDAARARILETDCQLRDIKSYSCLCSLKNVARARSVVKETGFGFLGSFRFVEGKDSNKMATTFEISGPASVFPDTKTDFENAVRTEDLPRTYNFLGRIRNNARKIITILVCVLTLLLACYLLLVNIRWDMGISLVINDVGIRSLYPDLKIGKNSLVTLGGNVSLPIRFEMSGDVKMSDLVDFNMSISINKNKTIKTSSKGVFQKSGDEHLIFVAFEPSQTRLQEEEIQILRQTMNVENIHMWIDITGSFVWRVDNPKLPIFIHTRGHTSFKCRIMYKDWFRGNRTSGCIIIFE
ncbi:reverse transcriptase zinc-binding domain-containing protein [Artemisia annua]|uniref:Reverse transcriptase zinc-binding domain-containing protein n=1 Tax=Artemisia annua TaxID=35608 RepID=A0A2U1LS28_ARTAN|nr:reverse transcriptase zinc-binding domain-containing protein [Artemisia annua]